MKITFKPIVRKVIETEYGDFDFEEVYELISKLSVEKSKEWDPSIIKNIGNEGLENWLIQTNIAKKYDDGFFYQGDNWLEVYDELRTDIDIMKKLTGKKYKYD